MSGVTMNNVIKGTVRQNELETGRAVSSPRRMTKHSPSRYMKPGPGFLDHPA